MTNDQWPMANGRALDAVDIGNGRFDHSLRHWSLVIHWSLRHWSLVIVSRRYRIDYREPEVRRLPSLHGIGLNHGPLASDKGAQFRCPRRELGVSFEVHIQCVI